jgi:hypothetical protein
MRDDQLTDQLSNQLTYLWPSAHAQTDSPAGQLTRLEDRGQDDPHEKEVAISMIRLFIFYNIRLSVCQII